MWSIRVSPLTMAGGWSFAGCGPLLRPGPLVCIESFAAEAAPTRTRVSAYVAGDGHAVFGAISAIACRVEELAHSIDVFDQRRIIQQLVQGKIYFVGQQ